MWIKLFNEIKDWLIRTFIVLVGFLFFAAFLNSVSANPINCKQSHRSYSSIDLKISEEKNFKVIENDLANTCKRKSGLVTYRSWGIGVEAVAAKGGVQYTKSSLKLGQEMHKAYKVGANGVKEFRLPGRVVYQIY